MAAVLRFATLGEQSFSADESFTVHLARMSFGGMLHQLPRSESTPPLHYVLVWLWGQIFGTGEVGLRSLSAIAGTLTVPAVYATAREAFSRRAGVVAAALATCSPILVWYSQEARSYALLALLAAVGLYWFLRCLRAPSTRALAAWGACAALALCTHYFALFVVGPEGAWLVWRARPRRSALLACVPPLVCILALAPLAYAQRHPSGGWSAKWTTPAASPLLVRLARIPRELLLGYKVPAGPVLAVLVGLVLAWAVWRALRHSTAQVLLSIAFVGFAIPIAAALVSPGLDLVLSRFFLAAAVPVLVVAAGGLAESIRVGRLAVVVCCLVGLVMVGAVAADPAYQRPAIGAAARALGPAIRTRFVVVTGEVALAAQDYLAGSAPADWTSGGRLQEVDVIAMPVAGAVDAPELTRLGAPVPGFRLIERRSAGAYTVLRFTAERPRWVRFASLLPGFWRGWTAAELGRPPQAGGLLQ